MASGAVSVIEGALKGNGKFSILMSGATDAAVTFPADVTLHLPDYLAAERTFQLVAQVAGRAGRGEAPGRVIIQTSTSGGTLDSEWTNVVGGTLTTSNLNGLATTVRSFSPTLGADGKFVVFKSALRTTGATATNLYLYALQTLAVTFAAYRSAETGQIIEVDPFLETGSKGRGSHRH